MASHERDLALLWDMAQGIRESFDDPVGWLPPIDD